MSLIFIGTASTLAFSHLTSGYNDRPVHEFPRETREEVYGLPCSRSVDLSTPAARQRNYLRQRLIEPAHPVKVMVKSRIYAVPYGYFASWSPPERLNCPPVEGTLSVQYWIPSLDAPEGKISVQAGNRPSETKRPQPGPDESVVHVFRLQPIARVGVPKRSQAEWIIDDWRENAPSHALIEQYGLWRTQPRKGDLETVYWFRQDDRETFVIECSTVNDRCAAYLDMNDKQLTAIFMFAREAVPQHATMVAGLRTLLDRWALE